MGLLLTQDLNFNDECDLQPGRTSVVQWAVHHHHHYHHRATTRPENHLAVALSLGHNRQHHLVRT